MRPGRDQRLASLIKRLAAEFLERELATEFILTVHRAALDPAGRQAKIYVSIFPDSAATKGMSEVRRLRRPLQLFLRSQLSLKTIPYLDILLER